jgi:hypothetical protein
MKFLMIFLMTTSFTFASEVASFECGSPRGFVHLKGTYSHQPDSNFALVEFSGSFWFGGRETIPFTKKALAEYRGIGHIRFNKDLSFLMVDRDYFLGRSFIEYKKYSQEMDCRFKVRGEVIPNCNGSRFPRRKEGTGEWYCYNGGNH